MNFADILFVADYDNTMTGERHLVPQENLDAILDFTSRGGAFTLASGRGKREWYSSFHEVPFNAPLILSNGATIYDTKADKILYHAFLTDEQKTLATGLFLSLPQGVGGLIEADEIVYIPEEIYETSGFKGFPGSNPKHPPLKDIPPAWDKISYISSSLTPPSDADKSGDPFNFAHIDTSGMDILQRRAEKLGLTGVRSLPMMYEIPPEGTDKGSCARRLMKMLGKKVLVCAGDAPNDLAMLKAADICFVPRESILIKDNQVPEGAVLTVRCEEGAIADAMRILESL